MHDVTYPDPDFRPVVTRHPEFAGVVDSVGATFLGCTPTELDANPSAERVGSCSVLTGDRAKIVQARREAVEESREERVAAYGAAGFGLARGGLIRKIVGIRVGRQIASRPDHHRPHHTGHDVGFGEETCELAVGHHEVVGPLQAGREAGDLLDRGRERAPGGHRHHTKRVGSSIRAHEHGHE